MGRDRKYMDVIIYHKNGEKRSNPLMMSELHIIKTFLNEIHVARVEISIRNVDSETYHSMFG